MDFLAFKALVNFLFSRVKSVVDSYYREQLDIQVKKDLSPLTEADLEIEKLIVSEILKRYPTHSIHGEEFGEVNGENEFKWIIDPIDGTKSFVSGVPLFSTIIGVLRNGNPIYGAYINSITNDVLISDGKKCFHNNKETKRRDCKKLEEATLLTSDHFVVGKFQHQERFDSLARKVKLYRTWGDAFAYFLLCTGYADIMIDPIVAPWDALPVIPILRGADVTVTDYHGNDPVKGNSIIAANTDLHQQVIEFLH